MEMRVQAIYKDGVLRPLEPLPLEEKQQVTVTITAPFGSNAIAYFSPEEWAEAALDDVSLEDVRQALATISGSLSQAVVALRQER